MLLSLSGCIGFASASLPPALSPAEELTVEGANLPLTVGVVRHVYPAYSDSLVKALENTGLFDRVAHEEEFLTPPDLLARVDRQIHGNAMIPFWTLLTLGLVPTSVDEHHGYSFWLEVPGGAADRWHVEYDHLGRTTLGWLTLFEVIAPDRIVWPFNVEVRSSQRMMDHLSLQILEHRAALTDVARGAGR